MDLACAENAHGYAERLARLVGGTLVTLDESTRVYRIALGPGGRQIDVAQLQGPGILADLARRDFTCNAMAAPLRPDGRLGDLIDPRDGLRDLKAARLRADDPEVFREDPLRMLRAFRIAAELGLKIDKDTLKHIRARRRLILRCSAERLRAELLGLLAAGPAAPWLERMDAAGLLTAVLPELEASRRCALSYYGRGGVLRHSLDAVARMDFLLEHLGSVYPELQEEIRAHLGRWSASPEALLRLAVLLHDVAKPATARRRGGRLRFFGHDERGASMGRRRLERLRFSTAEVERIAVCILHHLRPGNLAHNANISPKAVYRFFRELGEHGVALLLVCWADHASYLPLPLVRKLLARARRAPSAARPSETDPEKTLRHLQVVSFLLKSFFRKRQIVRPPRLLDGHAVMKALGLAPGPAVGKALAKLEEAQAMGRVRDRPSAIAFIRRLRI